MAWSLWGKKSKPENLEDKFTRLQRKQIDDPTNPVNNYNLGVTCYKRGMLDSAANNFEHAVSNVPDNTEFKIRLHYNLAQTESRRAESVLGPSWERGEVKDEILDNALMLTDKSLKQADAVLVLDGEHKPAKKLREAVELLQKKILIKKHQNQQKQDKNSQDQKNKKENDQQNSQENQGEDTKQDQQGQRKSDDKSDGKNEKGEKNGTQDTSERDQAKDKKGPQDSQKQGAGSDDKDAQSQKDKSCQDQPKKGDETSESGKQAGDKKEGEHNTGDDDQQKEKMNKGAQSSKEDSEEEKSGDAQASDAVSSSNEAQGNVPAQLSPHARAMLDAVDQLDAQNQQRAVAREMAKMNKGGVGRGQKPW